MLQNMQALEKAQAIRLRGAKIKKEIKALPTGEARAVVADLVENGEHDAFKVGELLVAVPRIGREQMRMILRHAGIIGVDRRLRELTPRQREALVLALRSPRLVMPASKVRVPGG